MTKQKPKLPDNADDKKQSERFVETVREREADETGEALEKAFQSTVTGHPSNAKTVGWK